jgi:hypothetical protein
MRINKAVLMVKKCLKKWPTNFSISTNGSKNVVIDNKTSNEFWNNLHIIETQI